MSSSTSSRKMNKRPGLGNGTSTIDEEERVGLIGKDGLPAPSHKAKDASSSSSFQWNPTRLLRYVAICAASAFVTFFSLRKQQKIIHWEEYHDLLEPQGREQKCYVSRFDPCYEVGFFKAGFVCFSRKIVLLHF